ncbi:alpha/beta fold hydrolase [Dactylosporangium cerinum]|uniref:Alpha/beta fold hydrolase n=1 Tax=Dactylosporangium cerinum TaxID=1434730 RepID=A0ABV9VXM5_9ACTN
MTALSHHRSGTGAPLLLIHGIGSRWQLWQPLLPMLSLHFDVVALDLPGFGASPLAGSSFPSSSSLSSSSDVPALADAVEGSAASVFPASSAFSGSQSLDVSAPADAVKGSAASVFPASSALPESQSLDVSTPADAVEGSAVPVFPASSAFPGSQSLDVPAPADAVKGSAASVFPASSAFPESQSLDVSALADAVERFAASVFPASSTLPGSPSFHVAGSSLGGGVALELGRRGVARSVTAFAPIGFWGPISRRWCQASVTGARLLGRLARPALPPLAATAAGRLVLFGLFFGHPARLDPATCLADVDALVAAPGFPAARAAFAGHRFRDPGALPDIPVTVAWGSRDAILPAFQARRAAAALPTARHVRLPGCGHLPFSDDPTSCATLIQTTAT